MFDTNKSVLPSVITFIKKSSHEAKVVAWACWYDIVEKASSGENERPDKEVLCMCTSSSGLLFFVLFVFSTSHEVL